MRAASAGAYCAISLRTYALKFGHNVLKPSTLLCQDYTFIYSAASHRRNSIVRTIEDFSNMGSSKEARVDESDLRETSSDEVKFDGSLEFVHEYGGNGSKASYQEASGAPVENSSLPLGCRSRGLQPYS
jgi:hypothetical protein